MISDAEQFWNEVVGDLRSVSGFGPLTPEEAGAELCAAADPLSDEEIDAIVTTVVAGERAAWSSSTRVPGPFPRPRDSMPSGGAPDGAACSDGGPPPLKPGQLISGRYEVVHLLGRGGMGSVWLVRDRKIGGAPRALKLIAGELAHQPRARDRFRREVLAMAQVVHPGAVAVLDADSTDQGVAYLVMEYVPGASLNTRLSPGVPMPLDWIARLLAQLCDVLQEAHDRGIVHRDLKPSNLMLVAGRPSGREQLKVVDFGIAKVLDVEEEAPRTQVGLFLGTLPYASPEQVVGKAEAQSDIYAVGVILYELLTGYRPFTGSVPRLVHDTRFTLPPGFSRAHPASAVPKGIQRVVLHCLSKDPSDRPRSARALWLEFERALPKGPGARGPKPSPRVFPWLLPACLGASLVIGMAIALVLRHGAIPPGNGSDPSGPKAKVVSTGSPASEVSPPGGGTIQIELAPPVGGLEVKVDGNVMDIGGPLVLPEGTHRLSATSGTIEVASQSFSVRRGGNPPLRVAVRVEDFASVEYVLGSILADVRGLGAGNGRFARYFSLNHLLIAGAERDELDRQRKALAEAIGDLGGARGPDPLRAIEPTRTVFRVDLRPLGWDEQPYRVMRGQEPGDRSTIDRFDLVLLEYPYGEAPDHSGAFTGLAEEYLPHADLVRPIPYVRSDWFVAAVTRPPLREDLPRRGGEGPAAGAARPFLETPLRLREAAAELGRFDPAALGPSFASPPLAGLGLAPLASGGAVRRDVWEGTFGQVLSRLEGRTPIIPLDGLTRPDVGPDAAGAAVELKTNQPDNVFTPGGEGLVLFVENRSERAVHIELVCVGSGGKVAVLTPTLVEVPAGETFRHPPEGAIEIRPGAGRELVTLFASPAPYPAGEHLRGMGVADRFVHRFYELRSGQGSVMDADGAGQVVKKTIAVETR